MKLLYVLLIVTFCLLHQEVVHAAEEYAPIVQLKAGPVRGLVKTVEGEKMYSYEGIRFAQATRFSAPKPATPWTEVYNATRYRFACPQADIKLADTLPADPHTVRANEDCLYLNLFVPATAKVNRSVMVWIHGGGFLSGTIFGGFDGRYMALTGDVIVVTVQYRLGAFGFLSGDSSDAPGNNGLRDQIEALKFVQENIGKFGGNPHSVTIFGESAGSMSVSSLVISPLARGLFSRAILQSGAVNSYLGSEYRIKSLNKTRDLGVKFNCTSSSHSNTTSLSDIVTCLRGKTTQAILDSTNNAILDGESFIPIYSDDLLPINPVTELKTSSFNVSILFGVTSGEGAGFIAPNFPMINSDDLNLELTKKIIGLMFQIFQVPYYREVAEFYTKDLNSSHSKDDLRRAIANSFGDFHLVCPEMLYAEQLFKNSLHGATFYSYRFSQQTNHGCRGWMDVCHGEDNTFVFGYPVTEARRYTAAEKKLSENIVRAWTNFATSKDASPGKMENIEWKSAFETGVLQYMDLRANAYKMVSGFYQHTCDQFWKAKIF